MSYCSRVVVQAPGKLNLCLHITGTDDRGYHTLETVMQSVDLSDILIIRREWCREGVQITCTDPLVPEDDRNIIHTAANLFFTETGIAPDGLSIHIDKHLPVQAGLAGGSADAAAVLVGLNRLYEAGLTTENLCDIGLGCGADVPFCIVGGCCLAKGIGEVLTPLGVMPDCSIAIAKPPSGMSTKAAFKLYDSLTGTLEAPDIRGIQAAIAAGDLDGVAKNLMNVFEQVTNVGMVELLKGIMLCDGAAGALMSGSGTAVFGLFHREKDARRSVKHLREQVSEVFLAKPIGFGARVLHWSC